MSEPTDDYEPTETDLDLVLEEATGKPVKPASLAAGMTSVRQRLVRLVAQKMWLLYQLDTAKDEREESLKKELAVLNKDLATARERLAHFEAQLGKLN